MKVLDCLGKRCPLPVILLARHIGDVEVGDVVRVLADDPAAAVDIPAWCRMRGHEYVGAVLDDPASDDPASDDPASEGPGYDVRRAV